MPLFVIESDEVLRNNLEILYFIKPMDYHVAIAPRNDSIETGLPRKSKIFRNDRTECRLPRCFVFCNNKYDNKKGGDKTSPF